MNKKKDYYFLSFFIIVIDMVLILTRSFQKRKT